MAVQATPPTQVPADYDRYAADDERGHGRVAFAGTLLLMLGTLTSNDPRTSGQGPR